MALDNNIPFMAMSNVKVLSPQEHRQNALAMQMNKLQAQNAQFDFEDKQRGRQGENALALALSGGIPQSDIPKTLYGQGFAKQGMAYQDKLSAQQKAELETDKLRAEASSKDFETNYKRVNSTSSLIGALADKPNVNRQDVYGAIDYAVQSGLYTPDQAAQFRAHVDKVPDDQIVPMLHQTRNSVLTAKDQMDKLASERDAQFKVEEGARNRAAARERAQIMAGTMQGKNQILESDSGYFAVNPTTIQVTPLTVNGVPVAGKGTGKSKVPVGYRELPDGSYMAIPGGPADKNTSSDAVKKNADSAEVIGLLNMADPLVNKATGSGMGNIADKGLGFFGVSTESANAAASLKAIQGLLVSKMPKMSGPQSDKDVLLYREMAGQIGDPNVPAPQKKAAMQTIRQINAKYAGQSTQPARQQQPVQSQPAKNPQGWTLHTDANGNKAYVSPDGKQFQEVK